MVFGVLRQPGGKSWILEVFKMSMYMAFPVGCFYIFNKPEVLNRIGYTKKDVEEMSHLDTTGNIEDARELKNIKDKKMLERERRWKEQFAARK